MMVSKTGGQIKIVIYAVGRRVRAYIGFRVITTRPLFYLHKHTNASQQATLEIERSGVGICTYVHYSRFWFYEPDECILRIRGRLMILFRFCQFANIRGISYITYFRISFRFVL